MLKKINIVAMNGVEGSVKLRYYESVPGLVFVLWWFWFSLLV
jgi:hypothetical protein